MINKVPISMLVKVEDFHNDQQSYFDKISSKIEFNGNKFFSDRYLTDLISSRSLSFINFF